MKVAYIFKSNMATTFQLGTMILPQLEQGLHGADVVGMMFFDDNLFSLAQGNDVGRRLAKVAKEWRAHEEAQMAERAKVSARTIQSYFAPFSSSL